MFDLVSARKPGDINFGDEHSLHFFVKWTGKDYDSCKWENEYFLQHYYEKILKFAGKKYREYKIRLNEKIDNIDHRLLDKND